MPAKFIIVGTGRCGTEMLMNIFNLHPDFLVFNEAMFLFPCITRWGNEKVNPSELIEYALGVSHVNGDSALRFALACAGVSESAADEILDEIRNAGRDLTAFELLDMIGCRTAEILGKKYWAEKCPDGGYFVQEINREWPATPILHVVRTGIPTAVSMQMHPGFRAAVAAKTDLWVTLSTFPKHLINFWDVAHDYQDQGLHEYLELWGRRLLMTENNISKMNDPALAQRILFEELLENSREVLLSICDHIGITADEEWLAKAVSIIDTSKATHPLSEDEVKSVYAHAHFANKANRMLADTWPGFFCGPES